MVSWILVKEDDEGFNLIQPTLIQQLKTILDQYPDDGQILKVRNVKDLRWLDWIFGVDTFQLWALTTSAWVKIWKKGYHNCII